jgi:adenylate kinase
LDGFPRTVAQAESLDATLNALNIKLDSVINIEVPREKLMDRLTGRRVCKSCGASYHVIFNPPQKEGICNSCGGELYQRSDDNAETVGNRLDEYVAKTQPLIDFYNKQSLLLNINGDQEICKVLSDILGGLKK